MKASGFGVVPLPPVAFGPFRLDEANARLWSDEQALDLPPKAFQVLCRLAERPGQLVTKDELLDAVWGHRFVSESVLKTAVNTLRTALGDASASPRYIETARGRGYRFVAATAPDSRVSTQRSEPAAASPMAAQAAPIAALATAPTAPPETAAKATSVDDDPSAEGRLVGRESVIEQLLRHVTAAGDATPRLLLVSGEAGVGKTTLIDHVARRASEAGWIVARGQCSEQSGGGEPYLPLLDALAGLCAGPQAAAWLQALRHNAPTWLAQLPWFIPEADRAELRQELAGAAQDRMLREFAILLDRMASAQPVLVALDDLHWSDHATIHLLGWLARRRGSAGGWRVLGSFRPADLASDAVPLQALRHELRLHGQCLDLALDSLGPAEVEILLAARLGPVVDSLARPLAQAIHAHTEGLPLFVASVLDELLGSQALVRDAGGAWTLAPGALARLGIPETIAGILARRIARLDEADRELLETAGTLGVSFTDNLLAQVLERPAAYVQARCDALCAGPGWLREAGMTALPDGRLAFRYAFRHALYRRVLRERGTPARRLQRHLGAARALLATTGEPGPNHAEVAQQWEGARDIAAASGGWLELAAREAVSARLRAAEAATAVHAPEDALAHYEHALAGEPEPEQRVRIQAARAGLLTTTGLGPGALLASTAAMTTAATLADPPLRALAALSHAEVCVRAGRLDEALALTTTLLQATPSLTPLQRLDAMVIRAEALRTAGRLDEADDTLQAAALAAPTGAPGRIANVISSRVRILFQRGSLAEALPYTDQARALYAQAGDGRGVTAMLIRHGAIACLLDRRDEAREALESALARARSMGDVDGQRGAVLNLVKLHTDSGDVEAALPLLEEGWRLSPDFESPLAQCAFVHGYFYCNYLRGRLADALRDAARVMASAQAVSSVYWQVGSAVLVFDLYLHLGDFETARALTEEALAREHVRQEHQQWVKIALRRAWLLLAQGDPHAATGQLDEIVARGEVGPEEDRGRLAHARAETQLALGDAGAALATLAPFEGAATLECWALMLALRLRARPASASASISTSTSASEAMEADIARAREQLSDRRLPPLESLLLRRALVGALERSGRGDEAALERAAALGLRRRLADSLGSDEARRKRLLERFAID